MPVWFEKFEIIKKQQLEANNENISQLHQRLVELEVYMYFMPENI